MNDEGRNNPHSPSSTISEDTDGALPANLASEELWLTLNKEASEEEYTKAIGKCKQLILENSECSVERKWLVRHLIELRLRFQEHKEAMGDPQHPKNKSKGISNRTIQGHHLKLQPLLKTATHPYCDHCTGMIWSVVQAWYMCEDCGYCCHYKCMGSIVRECAHVIACERGEYELKICPELGMSSQKYLCAECKTDLILTSFSGLAKCLVKLLLTDKEWTDVRKCDYTGSYYCSACHWGSSAIIPARVVHNWDFEPRPVSQASLQILKVTADRPIINLERLNPQLFNRLQELNLVKRLRQELQGMRKYLIVCRRAEDEHLLWRCDKPHLIENVDMYSLQDLVDTFSCDLLLKLQDLVDVYSNHVKKECEVCKGRGHICEVCKNTEVLYPFASTAYVCPECMSVFHKPCFERMKQECPKCFRMRKRLGKGETKG